MQGKRLPGGVKRAGGLAAWLSAVVVAAVALSAACPDTLSELIQECQAAKAAGTRKDSPGDCGCNPPAGAVCAIDDLCVNGACCDPALLGSPCYGMKEPSDGGSACSSDGGPGQCSASQTCQSTGDGGYSCQCEPALNQTNGEDCGCTGPCNGATCTAGACQCPSAEQIYCNEDGGGGCVPIGSCPSECIPTQHETDDSDCWCNGPCASGDDCSAGDGGSGGCVCDPLAHLSDNLNCGCHGKCDASKGLNCDNGVCECETSLCPEYQTCSGGACKCDSTLCPSGDKCAGGTCKCDPAQHTSATSCGCPPATCGTGKACKAEADGGHHCN